MNNAGVSVSRNEILPYPEPALNQTVIQRTLSKTREAQGQVCKCSRSCCLQQGESALSIDSSNQIHCTENIAPLPDSFSSPAFSQHQPARRCRPGPGALCRAAAGRGQRCTEQPAPRAEPRYRPGCRSFGPRWGERRRPEPRGWVHC